MYLRQGPSLYHIATWTLWDCCVIYITVLQSNLLRGGCIKNCIGDHYKGTYGGYEACRQRLIDLYTSSTVMVGHAVFLRTLRVSSLGVASLKHDI